MPGNRPLSWVESKAAITPAAGKFSVRCGEDGMNVMQGAFRAGERAAVRMSG